MVVRFFASVSSRRGVLVVACSIVHAKVPGNRVVEDLS